MKEKRKVILIILISLLIGLVIGVSLIFITKTDLLKTNKNNNNENSITTTTPIISSENNQELVKIYETYKNNNYYSQFWNIDKIYKENIEPDFNYAWKENAINYNFIKLDNNKLMWNIKNEWIKDDVITENIKMYIVNISMESSSYIYVLTQTGKLYIIDFDSAIIKTNDNYEIIYLEENLNSNLYYELNEYNFDSITFTSHCECGCWKVPILRSNNIKYYLIFNNNKYSAITIEDYYKNTSLSSVLSCGIIPIDIDYKKNAVSIKNELNQSINVKYYFAYKGPNDDDILINNILIDYNDNIYYFNSINGEKISKQIVLTGIAKAKSTYMEGLLSKYLTITLDNDVSYKFE